MLLDDYKLATQTNRSGAGERKAGERKQQKRRDEEKKQRGERGKKPAGGSNMDRNKRDREGTGKINKAGGKR